MIWEELFAFYMVILYFSVILLEILRKISKHL